MDKEKLAEIRGRVDKTIQGPWIPKKFGCSNIGIYKGPVKIKGCGMNHGGEICRMDDSDCSDFKASHLKDTATFIAHARQDIPYLLNEVEMLQLEKDDLCRLRPLEEWDENCGDVLWWILPISEAPYCGTPNDLDWPEYHTHWSKLPRINDFIKS